MKLFAHLVRYLAFALASLVAACPNAHTAPEQTSEDIDLAAPPRVVDTVVLEDVGRRVVFDRGRRSDETVAARHSVCVVGGTCVDIDTNYVDIDDIAGTGGVELLIYALDPEVPMGEEVITVDPLPIGPLVQFLAGTGPTAACYSSPPTTIWAPVFGSFRVLGASAGSNITDREWSFWQHRSGYHRAGGGISGANDTYAWDANVNTGTTGSNRDVGMEFFGMGYGTALAWGTRATDLLVDACGWHFGYLHGSTLFVRPGDYVTPRTALGRIGRTGTDNDHLHFVVYSGPRTRLVSYDALFLTNPVTIRWTSSSSLALGSARTSGVFADRYHASGAWMSAVDLNSSAANPHTWWTSSASTILSVDGNGILTPRARGSATISVSYSGERASRVYTVY